MIKTKKVTKQAAKKTPAKKTPVKAKAVKKSVKTTGNKELDKMLLTINAAKKSGSKNVVVYTTSEASHKANTQSGGFGVDDLKPKLREAYKYLFCNYDLATKLVDASQKAVSWTVKF